MAPGISLAEGGGRKGRLQFRLSQRHHFLVALSVTLSGATSKAIQINHLAAILKLCSKIDASQRPDRTKGAQTLERLLDLSQQRRGT